MRRRRSQAASSFHETDDRWVDRRPAGPARRHHRAGGAGRASGVILTFPCSGWQRQAPVEPICRFAIDPAGGKQVFARKRAPTLTVSGSE
jgi:hypothetical protein